MKEIYFKGTPIYDRQISGRLGGSRIASKYMTLKTKIGKVSR